MRKLLLALPFLFLLAGCQCRQGSQAPMVDSLVGEVVEAAFEPVFEAAPIPPAVEARMRGVSYPENAEIKLDDLRYLKLSYIDFEGRPQVGAPSKVTSAISLSLELQMISGCVAFEGDTSAERARNSPTDKLTRSPALIPVTGTRTPSSVTGRTQQ